MSAPDPAGRRIEADARDILRRVQAIHRAAHDGRPLVLEEIEALTASLVENTDRLHEVSRTTDDAATLAHLKTAREAIVDAHLIVRWLVDGFRPR